MKWENVHIFVSSTFNDMHAERDYLVKRVFPRLSAWCEERRLRLIDIDLRWGVSEADATQNKRVVQVCLDRIDECRPFFLCFLGQRRGWVPTSDDVNNETKHRFPELTKEREWSPKLTKIPNNNPNERYSYLGNNSVTEMEILHARIDPLHNRSFFDKNGEKKDGSKVEHAFFFLREPNYLKDLTHADLEDVYTNKSDRNPQLADIELNHWREEMIPATGRPVIHYIADWNCNESTPEIALPLFVPTTAPANSEIWKNTFENWKKRWAQAGVVVSDNGEITNSAELEKANIYNKQFTKGRLSGFRKGAEEIDDIIVKQLQDAITERFGERIAEQLTHLQKELDQQEQFLRIASEGFIMRKDDLDELNKYIDNEKENRPFALTAYAGMGKTSLLAHWIDTLKLKSAETLHYRFIGGSDDSTNVERLLHSILSELKEAGKIDNDIPVDVIEMLSKLPDLLEEAGRTGKTILIIDALNQLETGMTDLYWIPQLLPKNIKLIVSFKRGDKDTEIYYHEREVNRDMILSCVKPFNMIDDRMKIVSAYLDQYFKELDPPRITALISSSGAETPLYLKVILSELRVFGVHNDLTTVICKRFGNTVVSAFDAILGRMENDPAYTHLKPAIALPHIFGWLAHSRYGLSVKELSDLLILENLTSNTDESFDVIYLIMRQLRSFLAKRNGRIDFFYESFKTAAKKRYTQHHIYARVDKEWHQSLANYFATLPLTNRHRLIEQAWQLYNSNETTTLFSLLTSTIFIVEKQSAGLLMDLIEDYDRFSAIKMDVLPDIILIKERLRLLAPILWQYPKLAKQTLLGGLLPIKTLTDIDTLQTAVRYENGVELYCLGGDIYSRTGVLQLDSGKFLAASPNGKMLLSIKESRLNIIEVCTFKTLRTYPSELHEDVVFMGAISDTGKIALMNMHGFIYAGALKVQSDRRFLLYSDSGGIITVINNSLCVILDDTDIIVNGTPSCIFLKESFMAFEMNKTIFVYHLKNRKWILFSSFPASISGGIKAIAISEDLKTILSLTIMRQLIRQDIFTGEILTTLHYNQEAGLGLTRIPNACGENAHHSIFLTDCESNTAYYNLNSKKGMTYQAALEANHPRSLPVTLVTGTNDAVLLLQSSAIMIADNPQIKIKGHVGGVTSVGFLNENKMFTLMKNDRHILFYNSDGSLASICRDGVDRALPLVAKSCGDYIAVSLSNHKVGLLMEGENTLLHNGNMPFSSPCEFMDIYKQTLFIGTKNEIKRTHIAAKFTEESIYKTNSMEQIISIAAINETDVAILIMNIACEYLLGIASNKTFIQLAKVGTSNYLCISPDKKYICIIGDSTWIVDVSTKQKTQVGDACRSACFVMDNTLACAFTNNGNMLDFIDLCSYKTNKKVYLPDKTMSMVSDGKRLLCGLYNGKAILLNYN